MMKIFNIYLFVFLILISTLVSVTSVIAENPIPATPGASVGTGAEASVYCFDPDPRLLMRIPHRGGYTLEEVLVDIEKIKILELIGGPKYSGYVQLPDGTYAPLITRISGNAKQVLPKIGASYSEWEQATKILNNATRQGIKFYDAQFVLDASGKIIPVDHAHVEFSADAARYHKEWKETWGTYIEKMTEEDKIKHLERARAAVQGKRPPTLEELRVPFNNAKNASVESSCENLAKNEIDIFDELAKKYNYSKTELSIKTSQNLSPTMRYGVPAISVLLAANEGVNSFTNVLKSEGSMDEAVLEGLGITSVNLTPAVSLVEGASVPALPLAVIALSINNMAHDFHFVRQHPDTIYINDQIVLNYETGLRYDPKDGNVVYINDGTWGLYTGLPWYDLSSKYENWKNGEIIYYTYNPDGKTLSEKLVRHVYQAQKATPSIPILNHNETPTRPGYYRVNNSRGRIVYYSRNPINGRMTERCY